MSSSSQQPQQQNIQAGSQAMDLAIVNENDTSKKTLSWEQKQACRVAEVKAEIAKMEMMNKQLLKTIKQIASIAETVQDKMTFEKRKFKGLKEYLDEYEEQADLAAVESTLWSTIECSENPIAHYGRYDLENMADDMEVAIHLSNVVMKTREKMKQLAEE
ncbi:uncharacterized protein BKA78DRAFT_350362 [Phyllosticta capitalensis]|uniref:uncharacterized protein n=1 Tax=Phyllosticta capitalensis TaxID=121624 RepID=UPI00312E888D